MPVSTGAALFPLDLTSGATPGVAQTNAASYLGGGGMNTSGVTDNNLLQGMKAQGGQHWLWTLLGVVIFLIILGIAERRLGEDPKLVGVSVYNFIAVGVMALLFLVVLKVILNKWKWAPLTDLANAA